MCSIVYAAMCHCEPLSFDFVLSHRAVNGISIPFVNGLGERRVLGLLFIDCLLFDFDFSAGFFFLIVTFTVYFIAAAVFYLPCWLVHLVLRCLLWS